jgi:zona occludens toxin (predicted ATPase)
MIYIENEKLPDDRGYERINNRFVSILGEIKRLRESLSINQSKLRDLIKKEYEVGNTVIVNGNECEPEYNWDVLRYGHKKYQIICYEDATSVVIKRKE